jgi:hypothetical protein
MSDMNRNRQETLTKAASAHRETLRKNLQHRLEVARAEGDEKLVRQLEAEAKYLHLN